MKKVLVVVGTRPEGIKLAPVIKALKADDRYDCRVCATGQHQEMLHSILEWFGITPDYQLNVMAHKQPLAHLAGRLLNGLYNVIEDAEPDTVMVQGDTNSAFIGALAGYYGYDHFWKNQLKNEPLQIAHVEAGLRTGDNYSPFPEEANRRLIGHLAHWNFAPTDMAADALHREAIDKNVFVTGNTVIDALFETVELLKQKPRKILQDIPADKRIILVTSHRRENYGGGLENICRALKEIALRYPNDAVVYPVHLNRHVQTIVHDMLGEVENIHLLEPMDYPDFVTAMMRAHIILTDSGGVQEEAPSLGKPVLVLRDLTERMEALSAGTVKMVGTETDKIIAETSSLMDDEGVYAKMAQAQNPYGDGKASQRILNLMAGEEASKNIFNYAA